MRGRRIEKRVIDVGDCVSNNKGETAIVVAYRSSVDADLQFADGTIVTCKPHNVIHGAFKNPNAPILCGIGFIGVGQYSSKCAVGKRAYVRWNSMITRCYQPEPRRDTYKTYIGCTVASEWHNFQNFATWAQQQAGFENSSWDLDKDTICPGNREYGANTCAFVPKEVNAFLVLRKNGRGPLPIGVTQHNSGKYYACLSRLGKQKHLGSYDSQEEAFASYKSAKEGHAKALAKKYEGVVDKRIYHALLNFSVAITD